MHRVIDESQWLDALIQLLIHFSCKASWFACVLLLSNIGSFTVVFESSILDCVNIMFSTLFMHFFQKRKIFSIFYLALCSSCIYQFQQTRSWMLFNWSHGRNIYQIYSKNVALVIHPESDLPIPQSSGTDWAISLEVLCNGYTTNGGTIPPLAVEIENTFGTVCNLSSPQTIF